MDFLRTGDNFLRSGNAISMAGAVVLAATLPALDEVYGTGCWAAEV